MTAPLQCQIIDPLASLLRHCEVYCVAGCCQEDAFNCGIEQVSLWLKSNGIEVAKETSAQIKSLRSNLSDSNEDMVETDLFMARWTRKGLDSLLIEVDNSLEQILKPKRECESD